jgi:hypothetical protein
MPFTKVGTTGTVTKAINAAVFCLTNGLY